MPGSPLAKIASRLVTWIASRKVYVPATPVPIIWIVCGPGVVIVNGAVPTML